jgi:hypothetical protein
MTEQGNNILKKKIAQLPEYTPDDALWNSIEAWLDFEVQVSVKVKDLPVYSPSDTIWEKIEKTSTPSKVRFLPRRYLYYAASVAALLLLSGILIFKLLNKTNREVQITTEIVYTDDRTENTKTQWPEPTQYINSLCRLNTDVCKSQPFIEKKKLLDELDKSEEELLRYEATFGSSETLEKSKVRIEKVRADVIKELLDMIEG